MSEAACRILTVKVDRSGKFRLSQTEQTLPCFAVSVLTDEPARRLGSEINLGCGFRQNQLRFLYQSRPRQTHRKQRLPGDKLCESYPDQREGGEAELQTATYDPSMRRQFSPVMPGLSGTFWKMSDETVPRQIPNAVQVCHCRRPRVKPPMAS